jgi:hypothetical protein
MENVILHNGLQSLTFGEDLNQSMENVTLPSDLNSLTFAEDFNQSTQTITLPSGLQYIRGLVDVRPILLASHSKHVFFFF